MPPAGDDEIGRFLQAELRRRRLDEVEAVEAAKWLDEKGLLTDSNRARGKPLRDRLRGSRIAGGEQRPRTSHGRWFVVRLKT